MSDMLQLINGEALATLRTLPSESVQMCVTSPPYFGLRDYSCAGQIGLETSPDEFIARLVEVFAELRRVLRTDGTIWVNMGDSYANDGKWGGRYTGLKPKDLIGTPWRLAFALQADGWWLRRDIIWHKPTAMPESVTDRPTTDHEYLFLLTKSQTYYYDSEAIKEPVSGNAHPRGNGVNPKAKAAGVNSRIYQDRDVQHSTARKSRQNESFSAATSGLVEMRNKRSVWSIPSAPYSGAHFATYPPALVLPCILAGSRPGDVVLDPFAGSGTSGMVAIENGRRALLIELSPDYCKLIEQRCRTTIGFGF